MSKYLRRLAAFFGMKDSFDKITADLGKTVDRLDQHYGELEGKRSANLEEVARLNAAHSAAILKDEELDADLSRISRVKDKIEGLLA